MTVSTFDQPDYNNDNGTEYPLNIDSGFAVLKHIAQAGACHEADPPSQKVKVDPIERYDGGTIISQSEQTTAQISFPSSDDRIDRVVLDEQNLSVSIVTGTEESSPSAPAIPDGKLPCAQVRVGPSDTEITNDQITDERKAFLFYAVDGSAVDDAQNVTQTYKGNDIDSDGDGKVDNADQLDGNEPSDLKPSASDDGSLVVSSVQDFNFGSGLSVTDNLDNTVTIKQDTGPSSGNYNSEEVTQTITSNSIETINCSQVNGYVEGNATVVDGGGGLGAGSKNLTNYGTTGTTTNGNGNLNGLMVGNANDVNYDITVRFSGIVE